MKADWRSQPFEECIEPVVYTTKVQRKDFLNDGEYPVISQEEAFVNGYWDQEADLFRVERPVVVFGDHTRVLKYIDFDFVLGADGVKVLKPRTFLHPRFFYYQLHTAKLDSLGYARHYRLLREHHVAYPEYSEQQRIVAILDEAFEGIATAKANAEQNLQNARELSDAYVEEAFAAITRTYPSELLGKLCEFEGGSQPPKAEFIYAPKPGYVRFLQIRDFGTDKHETYIPEAKKNRICREDDILLGRYGASVGKVLTGKRGAYNVALMKTVPNLSLLDGDFFHRYLTSRAFQSRLLKVAARSAQDGFSKEDIFGFPVPLAPLDKQREFVEQVAPVEEESRRLANTYTRKLAALDELKKSLLHQAFTGAL